MHDGEVRLEPLGSAHLEGLAELGRDPDVQRFTYVPSPWVEGFERRWLERYDQPDGERAGFAIVDDVSGEFLGMAALVRLDSAAREAEAGYIVPPAARGRGVAVRALRLLTEWSLQELELERVELRIEGSRTSLRSELPSGRATCAKECSDPFIPEGRLRGHRRLLGGSATDG